MTKVNEDRCQEFYEMDFSSVRRR